MTRSGKIFSQCRNWAADEEQEGEALNGFSVSTTTHIVFICSTAMSSILNIRPPVTICLDPGWWAPRIENWKILLVIVALWYSDIPRTKPTSRMWPSRDSPYLEFSYRLDKGHSPFSGRALAEHCQQLFGTWGRTERKYYLCSGRRVHIVIKCGNITTQESRVQMYNDKTLTNNSTRVVSWELVDLILEQKSLQLSYSVFVSVSENT